MPARSSRRMQPPTSHRREHVDHRRKLIGQQSHSQTRHQTTDRPIIRNTAVRYQWSKQIGVPAGRRRLPVTRRKGEMAGIAKGGVG